MYKHESGFQYSCDVKEKGRRGEKRRLGGRLHWLKLGVSSVSDAQVTITHRVAGLVGFRGPGDTSTQTPSSSKATDVNYSLHARVRARAVPFLQEHT